jgi:hypothetical protein
VPTKFSYNVTAQRSLGKGIAALVGYVGSQSRYLPRGMGDSNIPYPEVLADGSVFWAAGMPRPSPNFRQLNYLQFDATSSYNSFVAGLERSGAQGLGFRLNYTYADCLDDVSSLFSPGVLNVNAAPAYIRDVHSSRGRCAFSSTHAVNLATTWDLPGAALGGVAGAVLGGWRWSTITQYQSGVPIEVSVGFSRSRQNPLNAAGGERPSWAPGCDAESAIIGTPEQWFNPLCFVLPDVGTLGDVPSRVLSGPSFFSQDWSLARQIPFAPSRRLELRLEVFNVFNRTNFGTPSSLSLFTPNGARIGSAGRITRTVIPARQAQVGVKFVF